MEIGASHAQFGSGEAIPSPEVVARFVDGSLRSGVRLIRAVERGEGSGHGRRAFDRCDCSARCDTPPPPLRYDEYLVRRNRADRDVREGIGMGQESARFEGDALMGSPGKASAAAEERPSYAMPRLGEVVRGEGEAMVSRVEAVYRREVTLPTGNVIDVFA